MISIFPKDPKFFEICFAQIFKDSYFLRIFDFYSVFFRTFESVKIHELGSWSLYWNIRRSANPYEEQYSTNQNLILFIQHMIKFDLIQFCSSGVQFSGVLNIAWYLPLGYSHSSVTSNQINIFYGFGKMALS